MVQSYKYNRERNVLKLIMCEMNLCSQHAVCCNHSVYYAVVSGRPGGKVATFGDKRAGERSQELRVPAGAARGLHPAGE